MSQVTVISGVERRRSWSVEQKRALVEAASEPGANVSEIARQADLRPSQIFRWRRDFAAATPGFTAVTLRPDRASDRDHASPGGLVVEVDGAVVRIDAEASPALVKSVLRSLRS